VSFDETAALRGNLSVKIKETNQLGFFLLQDTQTVKNGGTCLVQHILPKLTDKQKTEWFIWPLCNEGVPGSLCLTVLSTKGAQA